MKKIILFLFLVSALVLAGCTTSSNISGKTVSEEEYINIPLSSINQEMQKFSYDVDGVNINYFVVRDDNGKIKTAFDACDVCGGHKGYTQEGNQVVCNNCGNRFDIEDIGLKNTRGGCWPSYLEHEIEGDNIKIKTQDLADGKFRFA